MRKFIEKLFGLTNKSKRLGGTYQTNDIPSKTKDQIINELLASIKPPRQQGLTELQELSALSSMHFELSEQYFEQMAYNEMLAHIQAEKPEERLVIKGRHSVWTELLISTKTAGIELKEKDEEQAVKKKYEAQKHQ